MSHPPSYQGDAWDRDACEPRYATEAGLRTIQMHADCINEHGVMPRDVLINNTDNIMDQFAAGRYAMVLAPYARYSNARQNATWDPDQLAVLPFPNWTPERHGPQRVAGWWVAAWSNSPQLEETAKWVQHMVSSESVELWSKVGGQVPTRTSIFADPEFNTPEFDYMRTMVEAWGDWSWILSLDCNTARFDADLNVAVNRVALGEMDPMAALEEAEEQFRDRQ